MIIKESAHINRRVADALVRQLAISQNAESLKTIAVQLANAGDDVALYLVLDQLFSMIPEFHAFIHNIDTQISEEGIELLGKWLISAGLQSLIDERVQMLYAENKVRLARRWEGLMSAK